MTPLFRKSPEKQAQQEAAKVEIDRLRALSSADLAVDLLPGLGPDGPKHGYTVAAQELAGKWLLRDHPGAGKLQTIDLMAATKRALNKLEDAGLVQSISYQRTPVYKITPDGLLALKDGTVRDHVK